MYNKYANYDNSVYIRTLWNTEFQSSMSKHEIHADRKSYANCSIES